MDIKQIRYSNTRRLVNSVGGVGVFAEKIDKSPSQASSFAGENPNRGIGHKIARQIEECFGKPLGWLDLSHDNDQKNSNHEDSQMEEKILPEKKILLDILKQEAKKLDTKKILDLIEETRKRQS